MIDSKITLKYEQDKIIKILSKNEFQIGIVDSIKRGLKEYNISRELDKNKPIQSYTASKGIERAKKIGDQICNNPIFNEIGVKTDVILSSKIPIIIIDNIAITIKSQKNPQNIVKTNTGYIKEYSKCNRNLDPQLDMLSELDDCLDLKGINSKYYGILLYHISGANTLEYVKFVFLDENAKRILLEVNVNNDIINSKEKIKHIDPNVVSEEIIKGKSLKGLVRIK